MYVCIVQRLRLPLSRRLAKQFRFLDGSITYNKGYEKGGSNGEETLTLLNQILLIIDNTDVILG